MHKILVVEDDRNILKGLVDNLEMEGYKVVTASDGEAALKRAKEAAPDLIILDIMMPKMNGFEVCKQLKAKGSATPIIILSAKAQESDKVLGLELGADDYVTKPFSPRELLVRIRAVLRRAGAPGKVKDVYDLGDIRIDFNKYLIYKEGKEERLTAAEYKILKLLIANTGEPVSRHTILAEIWGEDVTSRTVDTHIWSLREKMEEVPGSPKHIITVHRIGYKFIE
ncbi:MAG: response regulator transcription factor [Candidatus Omnitrophota bacterium]|jgi:two-component system alkaline phosphatase synthesis response regulator PhoP